MCLPLTPYKIEREWKHAGLSCAVVQGGYRAQYAYPKAFVRTAISERLAVVYGAQLID
jgi:hypothetical protein